MLPSSDNPQNTITSLEASLIAYEQTNLLQNEKISNQDILIIDLKAKISTLQRCQIENIKYQQDLNKANEIIQSKNKTISEYQTLSSLSTSKFDHYLKTNQLYKSTIDKQADAIKELKEKYIQAEICINDLTSMNESLKQKAFEMNMMTNTYIDPKTHKDKIDQLEDVILQLQHELRTSQQHDALLIAKNEQLKIQYKELHDEQKDLVNDQQEKNKELTTIKNQLDTINSKAFNYKNEIEHLNDIIRKKDAEINQLTLNNRDLSLHNQSNIDSLKQCEIRQHNQDEKIAELNQLCNHFESAYNTLIKDLQVKNSDIENLYQTISQKKNENEMLKNDSEAKIEEMIIEINELRNKNKNLKDILVNLKEYSEFIENNYKVNENNSKSFMTSSSRIDNDNHKYSYMLIDNLKDVIKQIDNNQSFLCQYDSLQSN